jgi:hypothetical protein
VLPRPVIDPIAASGTTAALEVPQFSQKVRLVGELNRQGIHAGKHLQVERRAGQVMRGDPSSPRLPCLQARIRYPSYFSSKTQPFALNGAETRVASIGCTRNGMQSERLMSVTTTQRYGRQPETAVAVAAGKIRFPYRRAQAEGRR